MPENAKDIHQSVLDAIGRAMLENDPDGFVPWYRFPYEIETFDGRRRLASPDDLVEVFSAVRAYYDRSGVTDISRRCIEASFENETKIIAMHETRLICGSDITRAPFPVLTTLELSGGQWQIIKQTFAIADARGLTEALMSAHGNMSDN